MYQTIKKKAKEIILTGALTIAALIGLGCGPETKPITNIQLAEIAAEGRKPISREDTLIKKLPYNSDIYITAECSDDSIFAKVRGQSVYMVNKNLGIGAAAQHVDGNRFDAHQEAGAIVRIQGKPIDKAFAKADIRYFPTRDSIDAYVMFDSNKIFVDMLGNCNTETKSAVIRSGVEYKFCDTFSLGLENKLAGLIDDLKQDYIGVRVKIRFKF